MKLVKILPILLIIVFIFTGCFSEITNGNDKKAENRYSSINSLDGNESVNLKKVESWKENKFNKIEYNLSKGRCKLESALIAPSYVDKNRIIFVENLEGDDKVVEFSRNNQTCKTIYTTEGIGNITGLNGKIYWTEYDTKKYTNVDWKIKSLDLETNNVTQIESGGSYKDTPPPTIRTGTNTINWIAYSFKGTELISQVVEYNCISGKKNQISKTTLDESQRRNGEYYIIQQGFSDKILIYKSIFDNKGKHFDISLYHDKTKPKHLLSKDKVIDFSSNDKYFTYTGEGHLTAFDISNPGKEFVFSTGNFLTTDSPIFINSHTLIFRYGMNEILIGNLKKGTVYSITGNQEI
ncbi:hypothetical protein, partial [Peribacillus tepidiphilus]|uniref:hypothetical protein n=1 Tax=Peribacillus tepidiphilus TaxID=2652445 RepID=UPI0035B510E3